jgi:FtsH-binding integral membrane protein
VDTTLTAGTVGRSDARRFYLWTAILFVLIAFGGFIPSYWARIGAGDFHPPPIMHIHGVLLFTWTLFYLAQAAWAASGRIPTHRAWGTAGIALFTLVVCSIVILRITIIRLDDARGFGDASRRFSAVAFCTLPVMIGIFALAIAKVRRPEVHKRLMYVLMSGLMIPALARVFLATLAPPGASAGGPPPPFVALPPACVAALLVVVGIVYDWRRGIRPHKSYVYGGLAMFLINFVAVFVAGTQTWMGTARWLQSLGG